MTIPTPTPSTVRTYEVRAETTDTFGRVECAVRQHRLTIDGPVQNGCPGEAPTPGEMFLAGAAACGAEVLQVLARDGGVPLRRVEVTVRGTIDRERQPHAEVTVFTEVDLHLRLVGPEPEQAAALVAGFQRRCPVYGSLAVASGRVTVRHETVAAAGS
ncbi:MAG TPA: OsmC family protein [Longimicrobium sp.]|nr:OsmC family protein [Longimicrobium sp.]